VGRVADRTDVLLDQILQRDDAFGARIGPNDPGKVAAGAA
jgi:hypothetical protein